jgi:hypothetical protein
MVQKPGLPPPLERRKEYHEQVVVSWFAFETPLVGQAPPDDSEALVTPYTQSIDHVSAHAKKPDAKKVKGVRIGSCCNVTP